MSASLPYFLSEPRAEVEYLNVEAVDTVVQRLTDHPMAEIAAAFDSTYSALFPLLGARGIRPAGPAFALYHSMPGETITFEAGIPVDRPLDSTETTESGIVLQPSRLPGGTIARISYFGPYDGLGDAWGTFMDTLIAAGTRPDFPYWELYVTEPGPDTDPATLRTDLVIKLMD